MGSSQYLILSKDGIVLPTCVSISSHFRLCRSWTDISQVFIRWHGRLDFQSSDQIILKFKSGGSAKLELSSLSINDLERLLLAIEMWAKNATRSDSFLDLKEAIQLSLRHAGAPSFTDIWEEELSRRFSNTVFVPLSPGTSLQSGRLEVLSQMAFGGFSAVYMVKDNQKKAMILKELVVPKNLTAAAAEQIREHFSREANILAHLNHPQLVKVLDFFVQDGRSYLLLEYIPGQNLRHLVPKGGLQESVVLEWGIQMCQVLEYLHSQNPPVIHRDFTPENLLLTPAGRIILIDFNAAYEPLSTATSTVIGKYSYMAPEQFRGHSEPASDLYSLGCVLFYLLTGQDPEPISINTPRQEKAEISKTIDDLIIQLTQFEPNLRPTSASAVRESLDKMSTTTNSMTAQV